MNAKLSGFAIYVKAIIYLLLDSLHDCTFKSGNHHLFAPKNNNNNDNNNNNNNNNDNDNDTNLIQKVLSE